MDKKTAISKIRKCLALSKSANENEAATALKQAKALMNKFSVTDMDVMAAQIKEAHVKTTAKQRPPNWEGWLGLSIGKAFGCEVFFTGAHYRPGKWTFVGDEISSEIAQYAFSVLLRQLKRQRKQFIEEQCRRLNKSNKTRRADLFCKGWVGTVYGMAKQLAPERKSEALTHYMEQHHKNMPVMADRDRNKGRDLSERDIAAYCAGKAAGETAQLNRAMSGNSSKQALIGVSA
ncbi:DUF2786 domain-containing protein [Chromobacterium subtsugae]|uniref:DUF2786 domain-containing protein n=1 Tax=Chromobacterium subtsugae TaxID=251747 RepID=UPI000640E0DF|nr:DUF2786 domain-containing protein [Chromobacterium subtsugae]